METPEQTTEQEETQVQQETQVESVAEETQEEQNQEQVQEETQETATEENQEESQQEQPKAVRKIKYQEQEVEIPEEEIDDYLSKGYDYTRKTQEVAERRKKLDELLQKQAEFTQQNSSLLNNPNAIKLAVAEQMGFDPKNVFSTPQPPNPAMQDYDLQGYVQQLTEYNTAVKEQQAINRVIEATNKQNADRANGFIIETAKMKYGEKVKPEEFNQMIFWAQQNIRPNAIGVYPDNALDVAYLTLFNQKDKETNALRVSDNIQKKIKDAGKNKPIQSQRKKITNEPSSSESDFLKFTERTSGKK